MESPSIFLSFRLQMSSFNLKTNTERVSMMIPIANVLTCSWASYIITAIIQKFFKQLSECLQCYCSAIRQLFSVHVNPHFSKSLLWAWSFDIYRWMPYEEHYS
jgi:hypothetical protein